MLNLRQVHLKGLRAVEAVGRLGSMRAAADELGVTVGAVSQQVLKTEEQIGRTLFARGPKGLRPTPLGEEVVRRLTAGFGELAAALALADQRRDDALTVSVAPVLAGKWLVWRLHRFAEAHPAVRVRLDASLGLVDPNLTDVDACIRVGWGDWPGVRAEKLRDQRVFPVCSPAMAQLLRAPADLARVPIIRDPHAMFGWDVWLRPNGLDEAILGDGPTFSDAGLGLDAAIAGHGVLLGWETLVVDALAMGRVVAPFPDRYETGIGYWFVEPLHTPRTPAVRAFRTWLKAELADAPAA